MNATNAGVRKNICERYVLPAMDYSSPSDIDVGVVNSWPHRPKKVINPHNIVHSYANVNASFCGGMYSRFFGRRPSSGIPSKVRIEGPMPPGSTRSNRSVLMRIYEERKAAVAAGIIHWSDAS